MFLTMSESKTVKIQVQLPEELRTRFKAKCVTEGTTMNQMVIDLVKAWTEEGIAIKNGEGK
jgi:hypothetical protein